MSISPAHLLCVYAEPLVQGRRVAVVADATAGLGERLMDLGARAVHVFDPDASRASRAEPTRGLTTRPLGDDLGVRDGAFDVALIPDLGALHDPAAVLARLRRSLGPEGALLAAAPQNAAPGGGKPALDYYELYDLVSLQFSSVRMVGQVPFTGVALAELGQEDEEPTVSVQTELIEEAEAPECFVAVASQADVRLDGYTIVQTPSSEARATVVSQVAEADTALLAEARLRADLLSSQLDEARARLQKVAVEGERSRRSLDLENDLVEAQAKLEVRAAEIVELKGRVRELDGLAEGYVIAEGLRGRARELESELSRALERVALLEGAARAAEEAAAELEERTEELAGVVVARTEEAASLLAELEELRSAPVAPPMPEAPRQDELVDELRRHARDLEDTHAREVDAMEARLRERAQAVTEAEREVRRRERMVQDLLATVAEAASQGASVSGAPAAAEAAAEVEAIDEELARENATLRGKLDALAHEVARRQAELEARAWRISELEEALSRANPAPPAARADDPALRAELGRVKDELDMLRKALAQEHEARVRAERACAPLESEVSS